VKQFTVQPWLFEPTWLHSDFAALKEKIMSTTMHELSDRELDIVVGGVEGFPGLAPGQVINLSPFGRSFDWMWDYVGATGTLPRPPAPR
jgi:hypothetical protein